MEPGFYNMDCMEAMKQFSDGFFDLAIVDPPYGDPAEKIGGATVRRMVRPLQGGTDSGRDSTATKFMGGGYSLTDRRHMG